LVLLSRTAMICTRCFDENTGGNERVTLQMRHHALRTHLRAVIGSKEALVGNADRVALRALIIAHTRVGKVTPRLQDTLLDCRIAFGVDGGAGGIGGAFVGSGAGALHALIGAADAVGLCAFRVRDTEIGTGTIDEDALGGGGVAFGVESRFVDAHG
jgi:hypothetical protein